MRNVFLVLVSLLMAMPCWAAKIHLNSGSTIDGKVVTTAADSVKIDVGGVPVTYYKDEIASIEGDDEAAKTLGLASGPSTVVAPESKTSAPATAAAVAPAASSAPVSVEAQVPAQTVAPAVNSAVTASAPQQAASSSAPSNTVTPEKKELILKFIDAFGTRQAMISNFGQMLSSLPADQAEKLRGIFSVDAIIQELVPVYDKHFSEAELTAFINFYSSSEGHKLVSTIPQIMKESVEVSAKYFEARMPEDLKNTPAPQTK